MKYVFASILKLYARLRYPVSMPEDLASDLGLTLSNSLTFHELIDFLTNPNHIPSNLCKFMPRENAEKIFSSALRKEKFQYNSLFSYYFNGSWMEFILQFDETFKLRRLYIRHKAISHPHEMIISRTLSSTFHS